MHIFIEVGCIHYMALFPTWKTSKTGRLACHPELLRLCHTRKLLVFALYDIKITIGSQKTFLNAQTGLGTIPKKNTSFLKETSLMATCTIDCSSWSAVAPDCRCEIFEWTLPLKLICLSHCQSNNNSCLLVLKICSPEPPHEWKRQHALIALCQNFLLFSG